MFRRRIVAMAAAGVVFSLSAAVHSAITVEQIEAYADYPADTEYAPVHFYTKPTITLGPGDQGGNYPYITFQALTLTNESGGTLSGDLYSPHADAAVGEYFYGISTVAYPFVSNPGATDVYCQAFDDFLNNVVDTQDSTGIGPAPGDFVAGVKVVNTSYVVTYGPPPPDTDTDALRRMDEMVARDNVTFVAGAVTNAGDGNYYDLNWSCFNSLAVSGTQTFNPTGGTGKQHADLYLDTEASTATAIVSGYATALYGTAQAAGQSDAMQNVVNRALVMAGADKVGYVSQTTNHLDTTLGAGEPDYTTSLSILNAGEKPLLSVAANGSIIGTPTTTRQGWAYGMVAAGAEDVVLIDTATTLASLTASLNWNVNSPIAGGNINTSTAALQLPDLTLEVKPVIYNSNTRQYTLGNSLGDATLRSAATGDNVQYLFSGTELPSGSYAFVVGGDSALPTTIGLAYSLTYNQWNSATGGSWASATNWTGTIPNAQSAVANFLTSPGLTSPGTITLDGSKIIGQLNFNNANTTTIAAGSGGSLILDDSGDSTGINPQINVSSGSHIITAPIVMQNAGLYGANITTAAGASLNISGGITGNYFLGKYGPGTLLLAGNINTTALALTGGTTVVLPTATLNTGPVYINANSTLTFPASAGTGLTVRGVPQQINLIGGTLSVSQSTLSTNRQLLVDTVGLMFAGSTNAWSGVLDLANNDLDVSAAATTLSTVTNQIQEGFNNGHWNGSAGILSTSAAADTAHLTALGVIQNNQNGKPLFTASHPFDGTTPGTSDILIKYTYCGDANLDGKVDGSDYSLIDNGYLNHLTSWYNGDFNYDGVVNGSDYTLIDNAYNQQGAVITAAVAGATAQLANSSSVPEPGGAALLLAGVGCMLSRRRKRRESPLRELLEELNDQAEQNQSTDAAFGECHCDGGIGFSGAGSANW